MKVRRPPDDAAHNIVNIRGLLLAAVLKPESLRLMLGCDEFDASRFQEDAKNRLTFIKRRIEDAHRT